MENENRISDLIDRGMKKTGIELIAEERQRGKSGNIDHRILVKVIT